MRYFDFVLGTSSEEIGENARVKLKEYSYEGGIVAVNVYMWRNLKKNLCFFLYREEKRGICASFSYNEEKDTYNEVYDTVMDMLYEAFCIKKVVEEACEITMCQYADNYREGKRRGYASGYYNTFADNVGVWFGHYVFIRDDDKHWSQFRYEEKIAPEDTRQLPSIYDKSFMAELENIEKHQVPAEYKANIVHYVISARSPEAANDMAEMLVQRLFAAHRIASRRIIYMSEFKPDTSTNENYLEYIIEDNYGGVIVFDLTEKFGYSPTDYVQHGKYLEGLLKKYRNHCLFIFTYNMDHPGYSYYLLPQLKKYIIPISLREGTGGRRAAVGYLKELIKDSEYAEYANQANEFFSQYPGTKFTQTDVLLAYERFEGWCLNKNVLQAYGNVVSDEFLLDRNENEASAYDKLHEMIGLSSVKAEIDRIIAADLVEKERKKRQGREYQTSAMHMIFGGNPGSAKTTVARLFAKIAKERGILKSGSFVEKSGVSLDGLGSSYAIKDAFVAAKGGVLFIDEAYSIQAEDAITVLLAEMENHREDVIVIFAGYPKPMKKFLDQNPGMASRIAFQVEFADYTAEELMEITKLMVAKKQMTITEKAMEKLRANYETAMKHDDYGNGRYVRKLLEEAEMNLAERICNMGTSSLTEELMTTIEASDIPEVKARTETKQKIGFM